MAKNKNRDRKQPQAERASQAARPSAMEQDEPQAPQVMPGDVATRKRQKRFGHN
ncbi:hypothetical protein ACLGIH_25620 [Streptomyces sp. HMX87]|uniref:hypothetical protein n=1 Tax=Streptomyces sp. HMX87 TaxID=3390849 RepID=UPI003A8C3E25